MLQDNIVKVVSRYIDGSVTVYTIGAFSFFVIHASLGILTLEGLPLKSQNAESSIHVDTGFLLVTLCIRPFAKTIKNENKVDSKGNLKISRLVSNYYFKFLKKWRIKCTEKISVHRLQHLHLRLLHCRFGATVKQISGVQMRESKGNMLFLMCGTARAPKLSQ